MYDPPVDEVSVTDQHILATARTLASGASPMRVLEAGCGDGTLLAYLDRHETGDWDLSGFDVVDSMTEPTGFPTSTLENLERLAPGRNWSDRIRAASIAEPWPFEDESFDLVISNQVLEHVFDYAAFFGELRRVLAPGGISIHVFPLRRQLWEFHLSMPLVHRVTDSGTRAWMIDRLTRLGWGTYRGFEEGGMSRSHYAATRSDFIDFGTYYPTWQVLVDHAKTAQLRLSHRFTRHLYLQRIRKASSGRYLESYSQTPTPLRDTLAFAVFPFLATTTVVLERPAIVDSWRVSH